MLRRLRDVSEIQKEVLGRYVGEAELQPRGRFGNMLTMALSVVDLFALIFYLTSVCEYHKVL